MMSNDVINEFIEAHCVVGSISDLNGIEQRTQEINSKPRFVSPAWSQFLMDSAHVHEFLFWGRGWPSSKWTTYTVYSVLGH